MKSPVDSTAGFSLLELLTVLVILGIFAAVSTPAIGRLLNTITIRNKTQNIVATLRYARLMSISTGQKVHFVLDTSDGNVFQISGGVEERRTIELNEEDRLSMEPPKITFYPESQVSAAVLRVVIGNQHREITLDPLTALPLIN
jgi:prepilin-type N-terminal cleavage/methylation domain-containing protein